MTSRRISELPDAGPLSGADRFPVEGPGGETRSQTIARLMAIAGSPTLPVVEIEVKNGVMGVNQAGGTVFSLPQLIAHWQGNPGGKWLEQNPEIWLFRQRQSKPDKAGHARPKRRRPAGWAHPTDHRWAVRHPSGGMYRGDAKLLLSLGAPVPLARVTEFDCPPEPGLRLTLSDFDPYLYFLLGNSQMQPTDLPIIYTGFQDAPHLRPMRRKASVRHSSKFCEYFCLRIVVDNLAWQPGQDERLRKIIGPPGATIRVAPLIVKDEQNQKLSICGLRYQTL